MSPGNRGTELEALHEIGRLLSYATDLSKAFTGALIVLRSYLGLENGTVSLFDPVTGEVFLESAPEIPDAERILARVRPGEGVVGRVFHTGMPAVVPDLAGVEERGLAGRQATGEPRALYALPVRDGRATLGVLTAERRYAAGPFSFDRDRRLLGVVADLFGPHIRIQQLSNPAPRDEDVPAIVPPAERFRAAVGRGPAWRAVLDVVTRVAPSRATVLLRGESGTGKEVIARALHDASPRAERPFVPVNCAALPEALLESELFGHERGAFTGAHQGQKGRFEAADGGTLFLDEIGELPLGAQVKLLRAIQERQFERVGGRRTITVDVRLVAATNRDLEAAVAAGSFRLDLFHRLQVVELQLPPLRERPEDVPLLAARFLEELRVEHGRTLALSDGAVEALARAPWPGNVRQLRNVLERLVVASPDDLVGPEQLEPLLAGQAAPRARPAAEPDLVEEPLPAGERAEVVRALERAGWVQAKAARLLGMTVRQLRYRVLKYGIVLERY
ncbi:MAG: sigma 54-interacting transcriptional regulator [Anaeromyxobacter sp.]